MGKINLLFPQKVRIFFLFLLFIINAIMFFLPYIPGAFPNVVKESPDAIIPDISFQYSFFDIKTFLEEIGSTGRQAYQRLHLSIVFAFPLVYGLFFYELIYYFLERLSLLSEFLPKASLQTAFFDFGENFTSVYITNRFPNFSSPVVIFAKIMTLAKFCLIILTVVLTECLGINFLLLRLNPKSLKQRNFSK